MRSTAVSESPAPAVTVVVAGAGAGHSAAVRLLSEAGFRVVRAGPVAVPPDHHTDVLAFLADGPVRTRVAAIRRLAGRRPGMRVVATVPSDCANSALRAAVHAGAMGLVLEDDAEHALAPTVRAVAAGQFVVPSRFGRRLAPAPLSHREKEVLDLAVQGLTNRQIAARLYLSESTVKTHLSSSFAKLDAHSRAEAAARMRDPDGAPDLGTATREPATASPE